MRNLSWSGIWVPWGLLTLSCTGDSPLQTGPELAFERVGEVHALHATDAGRGVFADVILLDVDRVMTTYQLAGPALFCQDKSLYFQEFDRDLNQELAHDIAIDVTTTETVFGPNVDGPGDLGDHKFTYMAPSLFMLTTVPGEPQARVLRFETDFEPLDDIQDLGSLARVGDEAQEDRLLDMGFGNDGEYLYAQFFNQPEDSDPAEWGAQLYKLDRDLNLEEEEVVQPEEGTFITGTSIVPIPAGQMGASEDRLQSFSSNVDYGNSELSAIHTFASHSSDLTLVQGSTQIIAQSDLDLYFPTGADWNETHQLWVVGYTQEIAGGVHGSTVEEGDACKDQQKPDDEEYREIGPSFIAIHDADWTLLETFSLNDGDPAFRVMLETQDDDIYVVYDEMDKYAWKETSQAKLEHYRISVVDGE